MMQRMSDAGDPFESRLGAGAFALLVFLCVLGGGKGFIAAIILGGLTFVMLAALFQWLFCAPVPLLRPFAAQAIFVAKAQSAVREDPAAVPLIQPSPPLAGEQDLAARKGEWRYEAAEDTPVQTADQDFDGDGVVEGSDEGMKPDLLQAPRDGQADNLKEIKGIGPKLEAVCHSVGVFHFDQIAAWNDDEVAWINANLIGFKGRVTRDNWVAQAKILAAGGETEFSQKVGKGSVY
jgi:predicted flap endonuclease-1-like 5' DNA nuclease